jgi:hypothetical protein
MRPLAALIAVMAGSMVVPARASAQTAAPHCQNGPAVCAYDRPLKDLNDAVVQGKPPQQIDDALATLVNPVQTSEYFVLALSAGRAFDAAVMDWERARLDKQVGAPSQASGTTDLVARPSTPELLGMAVQLGALTETVSGTTATFNGNAYGAYRAIIGQPEICLTCNDTPWKGLNFSASFDLSKQGSKQVPTAGAATPATPDPAMVQLPQSSRQLSSATLRYDIWNPLDPRSQQFKDAWSQAYTNHYAELLNAARALEKALIPILKPLGSDPDVVNLENLYGGRIRDAAGKGRDQLNAVFQEYFTQLVAKARAAVPDLDKKVITAAEAFARYSAVNADTVREASGKPQFTAQYTYNHPQSQPDTHDFKLIFGWSPPHSAGALFTMNLGGSLYGGAIPAGAKYGRVRDVQFAAQFDRAIGSDPVTHPVTFSLAGYAQYQFDPSVLNIGPGNLAPGTNIVLPQNAQVLLGTKGTLAVVQAKITINTKSGVNIPIAVSWANKTDLLKANDVRGHVGITYDFASLSQIFGGQ